MEFLPRLDDATIAERAYQAIKTAILEGHFLPGARIKAEELAESLGTSRMPVREGLNRLAAEGLVEGLPHRGFRVKQFKPEEIEEIHMIRTNLETMSIRIAISKATEEDISELDEIVSQMETLLVSGDISEVIALNREFHIFLYQLTGLKHLQEILTRLWNFFPRYAYRTVPGRVEAAMKEHRQLVDAFKERNIEAAQEAIKLHILESSRQYIEYLKRP